VIALPAVWQFLLAAGLDLFVGDPQGWPHPVRAIAWIAGKAESLWRATRLPLRAAGVLFWLSVVSIATIAVWLTQPWLNIYWIYAFLAWRDLDVHTLAAFQPLVRDDIPSARAAVARIVGRDTANLDAKELYRAIIETLAENLSDAIVAPLFYLCLFGPAGMAAYKAVNTLDSIAGHRNARYCQFGWASARLDDLANLAPARISAVLVWLAALVCRLNARASFQITLRDGASQPSPNSGYPEAAFAGALGIRLGGLNYYQGAPSRKAYLGDPHGPLGPDAFLKARRLFYASSGLTAAVTSAVLWVCGGHIEH